MLKLLFAVGLTGIVTLNLLVLWSWNATLCFVCLLPVKFLPFNLSLQIFGFKLCSSSHCHQVIILNDDKMVFTLVVCPFISSSMLQCCAVDEWVQNGMYNKSALCLYRAKPTCSYQHSFSQGANWSSCVLRRVPASAESVRQNCVLGRCANLCFIVVLQGERVIPCGYLRLLDSSSPYYKVNSNVKFSHKKVTLIDEKVPYCRFRLWLPDGK